MSCSTARIAFLILAPLAVSGLVQAQYIGPGTSRPPSTLTELLQNPTDGQSVQLRGRLLQKLSHNKYLFSDSKSQIRVQINAGVFPKQPIDDKTEIEIDGEVEKDFMETPEIDVHRAEVVTPTLRK